jgi:hypothetical protein
LRALGVGQLAQQIGNFRAGGIGLCTERVALQAKPLLLIGELFLG